MVYGASVQCEETVMSVRSLQLAALFVMAYSLSACASIDSPVDGIVIDTTTRKPIPGAFVIAQWVRHGSAAGVHSRTTCPHLEIVQADANGRYRIPGTKVARGNAERLIFSYKPGYEWVLQGERDNDERLMTMRPFTGTAKERFDSFRTYGSLRACAPWDSHRDMLELVSKLLPLYRAIDEEASALTTADAPARPGAFERSLQGLERDIQIWEESRKGSGAAK
jgi:hypothetical protein